LLRNKDEAFDYFKIYKAEVENQLERKIKRLRSDSGGEYFPKTFDEFCEEHGIFSKKDLSILSVHNYCIVTSNYSFWLYYLQFLVSKIKNNHMVALF
jgi:hypothetical protein